MSVRTGSLFVLARQIRADAAALVTLAAILFASSAIGAAFPQWLNQVEDEAIQYELRSGQEFDDVNVTYTARAPTTRAQIDGFAASFLDAFEPQVARLLGRPVMNGRTTADAPLISVDGELVPTGAGIPPRTLTPRIMSLEPSDITYVEGGPPTAGPPEAGPFAGGLPEPEPMRVVEVLVSSATADALDLRAGSTVVVTYLTQPIVLRVSGVFDPIDPDAYPWERNIGALVPEVLMGGAEGTFGDAVVTGDAIAALALAVTESGQDFTIVSTYGFPYLVDRIDAADAPLLIESANRMESRRLDVPVVGSQYGVSISIQDTVERFLGQRTTARAVGGVSAAGLLVAVLAVLILAAQLTAERRRASLALARARGGTLRQLAGLAALEAFLVAGIAGGLGWYAGTSVVDGRPSSLSTWLVGLLVGSAIVATSAVVAWEHRVVGRTERRDLSVSRATPRRLAAEGGLVVLAVAGVILLRRRGLTSSIIDTSVDVFMVVVPVLVALTVAVAVLRVYPYPLQLVARIVAARPGPVGFLGLSRAGRDPSGTSTPMVVLLVALSFAIFASVVGHSIRVEQDTIAWETVGADIRIDANGSNTFDPGEDVSAIAAAAGIAPDRIVSTHRVQTATVGGKNFDLFLLDPAAFLEFTSTWPVRGPALEPLRDAPDGGADQFPALVSPAFAADLLSDRSDVPVYLTGEAPVLHSVGVLDAFPGQSPTRRWAIARTTDADRVIDLPYGPTVLFLDAPQADLSSVRTTVTEMQPLARVTGREATFALARDAPLNRAVQVSFLLAFALAAIYCALAIVLALVVTGRSRSRNLSFLRTLGLSDRQARGLIAWEIVPMAAITAVVGVALGVGLPALVGPAIDLRPFTSGVDQAPLLPDVFTIAALAGGMLVVVVITTYAVAAFNRRLRIGSALRVGEES